MPAKVQTRVQHFFSIGDLQFKVKIGGSGRVYASGPLLPSLMHRLQNMFPPHLLCMEGGRAEQPDCNGPRLWPPPIRERGRTAEPLVCIHSP